MFNYELNIFVSINSILLNVIDFGSSLLFTLTPKEKEERTVVFVYFFAELIFDIVIVKKL